MVRILAMNPGHDGAVALVEDGVLRWSIEAEKDSFRRNGENSAAGIFSILEELEAPPDVIALGGWEKQLPGHASKVGAGYHGLESPELRRASVMGREVVVGSSSHERSHIFASIGMSQTTADDIVVLTWEGDVGSLYRLRGLGEAIEPISVMHGPGHRFGFLYCLADPGFRNGDVPLDVAGKLMALAGYGDAERISEQAREVVTRILAPSSAWDLEKEDFRASSLYNCGFGSDELRDAARLLADLIFSTFLATAHEAVPPGLPLIISGGCGLNCDWNSAWANSDHFSSLFVPPCPNDSGSAIGTAVDIQSALGLGTAIRWSVYSGPSFVVDGLPGADWTHRSADPAELAGRLAVGAIIPFVQGRAEIGPRALGHRSLLASALDPAMTERLNLLKGRESYRPIAPCCRDAEFDTYFEGRRDPYMLFFNRAISDLTPATTHVDGSARVQVVGPDNVALYALLTTFGALMGVGVLCNTSLNYPGRGFINRMSELVGFCDSRSLDAFVVEGVLWCRS